MPGPNGMLSSHVDYSVTPDNDSIDQPIDKKGSFLENLSGLFSGGSSLLGNALGFASNVYTNKMKQKLQQQQQDFNLKMWHLNNQYNTPSAQMKRLRDAGLNPNLMYQNGTTGVASELPRSVEPASVESFSPNFSQLGDSLSNVLQLKNQQRLTDAQVSNIEAQTENQEIKNASDRFNLSTQESDYLRRKQQEEENINYLVQSTREMKARVDKVINESFLIAAQNVKTRHESKLLFQQFEFNEESKEDRLEAIRLENGLTKAQMKLVKNQAQLVYYQSLQEKTKNDFIKEECEEKIKKLKSETGLIEEQIKDKEWARKVSKFNNWYKNPDEQGPLARFLSEYIVKPIYGALDLYSTPLKGLFGN